jgi:Ca2+-binding RTX toxin-like protein
MANYRGTNGNDTVNGLQSEANVFNDFGIGRDIVIGGQSDDTFVLSVDQTMDSIDGSKGRDLIDYSKSDRALEIGLTGANDIGHVYAMSDSHQLMTVAELHSIEDVIGSGYDDEIVGSNVANTLNGGAGDDTIFGYGSGDTLIGGDGIDTLDGGSGNDTLIGGAGADILRGGADEDTASYADSTSGVYVDLAANFGAGGSAAGDTYDSIEDLVGSAKRDTLIGDDGVNQLHGGDGGDFLRDGGGNDFVYGEMGDDTLIAGTGSDYFDGGDGIDTLTFENAANSVHASLGTVHPSGSVGWVGGAGAYEYTASGAYVAGSADTVVSIENLTGTSRDDLLFGSDDDNVLSGLGGNDYIDGGWGDDTVLPGSGSDTVYGGQGIDTISFANSSVAVEVNLDVVGFQRSWDLASNGDIVDGTVDTLHDFENITGSKNDDSLWGDDGRNVINGGYGNDYLQGKGGNDTLIGGPGQDFLQGGPGRDAMTGGADADTFYFADPTEGMDPATHGIDVITDYQPGVDTLAFSSQAFGFGLYGTTLTDANPHLVQGADPAARTAGPTFLFDTDSHILSFDQDGTGSAAATALAFLPGVTHLDHLVLGVF